jgi:DNA repair protein RadC
VGSSPLAHSVILAHNHPSGSLEISESDKNITQRIKKALELFDMSLLDHLIVTDSSYKSFGDDNEL